MTVAVEADFKVKDITLAKWGRKEIELAEKETLKVELRKFGGSLTANTEPSQKNFWKV